MIVADTLDPNDRVRLKIVQDALPVVRREIGQIEIGIALLMDLCISWSIHDRSLRVGIYNIQKMHSTRSPVDFFRFESLRRPANFARAQAGLLCFSRIGEKHYFRPIHSRSSVAVGPTENPGAFVAPNQL